MDPPPSSPIPPSDTPVIKIPKEIEEQQDPVTQAPDPPNSEPETLDPEDLDDQEVMMLSPSHTINDANVDEKESLPRSRSYKRGGSRRGKRSFAKNPHPRTLAALEKKIQTLAKNMKSVPFIPKALEFKKHEENLRKLGLWDFAHLEFDRKVRTDLVVKLIVTYNEKSRSSYIGDVRVLVNQADLARALNLPCKKSGESGEEDWPGEFISFVDDFVSSWMLLHEDTWMLPPEVMGWTGMIKEGHPEKVDWAKLVWFMVKRELAKGVGLESCYYASHLQHLIKCQKEVLLKEKSPDEVEEILVVKDDEEDEGDVKMEQNVQSDVNLENVPPSVESVGKVQSDVKMEENVDSVVVMASFDDGESIGDVQSDVKMEENVDDAGKVDSLGHGDKTADSSFPDEDQKNSGDQVEIAKTTDDHVDSPKTAVDLVENVESAAVDHVENVETAAVDHVENVESAAVDHVENRETASVDLGENLESAAVDLGENLESAPVDHVENLESAAVNHIENQESATADLGENLESATVDQVEIQEIAVDHVDNPESAAVDHVENLNSTAVDNVDYLVIGGDQVDYPEPIGDHAENLKPAAVDHVEYLQMAGEHVENLTSTGDAEDMNIDGDHVDDKKVSGDALEEIKTETNLVIDADAEMQDSGCNDLIDFEACKVDEHDPWDLSSKDSDQVHFLQQCTMSEVKQQAEEVEDDDDDEPEEDDPVQGFGGLSSGHLMQEIPYSSSDFDNNHMMLGGPSSIFGNSSKRELDLDPEISHDNHKRLRTGATPQSWDQKPQDTDFCLDQIQQWVEKCRMTSMSSQQATINQQQMFFNELGSKDHVIQQLKMNIQTLDMKYDELQRRRQSEITRYEKELYSMSSIIDGYRKALKSLQETFADFRKRSGIPPEPLYRDAGPGGCVKSVAELERERLKQEEDEKTAKSMVEFFEKEWVMKFKGHADEVEKRLARVSDIQKSVEFLKEAVGKKKGL